LGSHTATVSTKGQVVLPKAMRESLQLTPGTRVLFEETPRGYILRKVPAFAPTERAKVAGMLAYKGPPVTIEDMDAGVLAEARRRHAGN
jgi:AbrB family looped-hinge helix DNA binding protein